MRLSGYAARFGEPAEIGGLFPFTEVIRRGAFRRTLAEGHSIKFIHHHDWRTVLASTTNGTLRLWEDAHGLGFEASLPDTSAAKDLHTLVRRGDVDGMSFAFVVPDSLGEKWWEDDDGEVHRELLSVGLHEITLTPRPAYAGTSVSARDADEANTVGAAARERMQSRLAEINRRRTSKMRALLGGR